MSVRDKKSYIECILVPYTFISFQLKVCYSVLEERHKPAHPEHQSPAQHDSQVVQRSRWCVSFNPTVNSLLLS